MPRASKSLKSIIVNAVLFVGIFSIAAHLSVNFWERYAIQNELTNMKANLYTLREIIYDIGIAYDNLHSELKDLTQLAQDPLKHRYCNQEVLPKQNNKEIQKAKTVFTLGKDAMTNTRFPPKSQGIGTHKTYEYMTNVYPSAKNKTGFYNVAAVHR